MLGCDSVCAWGWAVKIDENIIKITYYFEYSTTTKNPTGNVRMLHKQQWDIWGYFMVYTFGIDTQNIMSENYSLTKTSKENYSLTKTSKNPFPGS